MVNKATTPRRRLYTLHTWVGFHLAWIMALILLTGTLAVIACEIDWLLKDEMRVEYRNGERADLSWPPAESARAAPAFSIPYRA